MSYFKRFQSWPITRKVSLIVFMTAGALITAVIFGVAVQKNRNDRARSMVNSTVLADIIGQNSTAALTFRDTVTGFEILSALKAEKNILEAIIYDQDGDIFTQYISKSYWNEWDESDRFPVQLEAAELQPDVTFRAPWFTVVRNITLSEKIIGHIVLRVDLSPLNQQLLTFYCVVGGFSFLLLGLMTFICSRLIQTILRPVLRLMKTMGTVSKNQDYKVSVVKESDDEIGRLIDGFNEMLEAINKRDDELASYRGDLEKLISVRTKELRQANIQLLNEIEENREMHNRLVHAQKMEAIGTLAGGVAHDLNNILSGVVSYPDLLLLQLPENSALIKPLSAIRDSGKKAAAIVQDLLTLARRGVKVEERVELKSIIQQYLRSPEFNELVKNHPEVAVRFQNTDPFEFYMRGSAVHLSKTLMNLVANGVEAITEAFGQVNISLEKVRLESRPAGFSGWKKGEYIRLQVADSGVGIAEENLERIFEPFFSHKIMGKSGTGLGMSVVWGTVEDHSGHISVESTLGEGTVFTLLFPADLTAIDDAPAMIEQKHGIKGEGQCILVVDDSEQQREIATEILDHLGYRSFTVASGEDAVQFLHTNEVELVLLDMIMEPGINGLETYKQILSFKPEQQVIIASGYSQEEFINEAKVLGVSDFIVKPYSVDRIGKALMDIL